VNENNTLVDFLIEDSTPMEDIIDINATKKDIKNEANSKGSNSSKQNNVKVNEISMLLDEGLSVDEISEKIGIGKGEVLLIKELYIK